MTILFNEWLTIVAYRDFHDVPRLILATDELARFWILDSKFDAAADEYSPKYLVYFAGAEAMSAQLVFARHAASNATPDQAVANVFVELVEFDQAGRQKLRLRVRGQGDESR